MKLNNSNIGKAQLRREQFNRSQTKSQLKGKKSLSKRIIAERVDGITKDNIDNEIECIGCMVKSDEILVQIMYHIKFGIDTYPSIFDDEKIDLIFNAIKDLEARFISGNIDAEQYLDNLEDIDNQIMDGINTISKYL